MFKVLKITITLGCLFCSLHLWGQTDKASGGQYIQNKKELLLGIPGLKNQQFEQVKSTITQTLGLEYAGYCETDQVILLKYENAVFPNVQSVITKIQVVVPNLTILEKHGDFNTISQFCSDKEKVFVR